MNLQLWNDKECVIQIPSGNAHHWYLKDRVLNKDVYVWAMCKFCRSLRLFRHGMPRRRDPELSLTFSEDMAPINPSTKDFFELEVERRQRAEHIYFKRDKDVLGNLFNDV